MKHKDVPTLNEVVNWPAPLTAAAPTTPAAEVAAPAPAPAPAPVAVEPVAASPTNLPFVAAPALTADQLSQHVLANLQKQVDLLLEQRLREVLTPLLQRSADSLVRDARTQLAAMLKELVTRAVTQELARSSPRPSDA
jgi:hypothetical protein